MVDRKMVELVRFGCCVGGVEGEFIVLVEVVVKGLVMRFEKMVKVVDCVWLKMFKGILDVLVLF